MTACSTARGSAVQSTECRPAPAGAAHGWPSRCSRSTAWCSARAWTSRSWSKLVGQAARRCVRGDDVVGHLGAAQFGLLFPRAGTFEARSAYRRVRDAVMRIEWEQGLICSAAGFAELEPGQTGAELLADARGASTLP